MPDRITWKITGLRELGMAIRDLNIDVKGKTSRAAVGKASRLVAAEAVALAPEDTGALKKAIRAMRSKRDSRPGLEWWTVGVPKLTKKRVNNLRNRRGEVVGQDYEVDPPEYYWRFLELGTVKMGARPFIGPALAKNKEAARNAMIEILKQRIIRAHRRQARAVGDKSKAFASRIGGIGAVDFAVED